MRIVPINREANKEETISRASNLSLIVRFVHISILETINHFCLSKAHYPLTRESRPKLLVEKPLICEPSLLPLDDLSCLVLLFILDFTLSAATPHSVNSNRFLQTVIIEEVVSYLAGVYGRRLAGRLQVCSSSARA